jgi:6-pyruvoyltetrahydropterin/6-carboxytetrahydropterin synthase
MSHRITRTHEIDAGHRVCGHGGQCAHLHGLRYRFALTCTADLLDNLGMVIDFSVIKTRLCHWLDMNWDHRTLIWKQDPWLPALKDLDPLGVISVPFNPTAEQIAEHMVTAIGPVLFNTDGVRLVACTVHETAKCSATFEIDR